MRRCPIRPHRACATRRRPLTGPHDTPTGARWVPAAGGPRSLRCACAVAAATQARVERPARWRSGEGAAPLVLRFLVRVPLGLAPRGPRHPRLCPGVPPPGTIGLGCRPRPCRVPRRGGANLSHPASGVATPPPTSFLPSFLPAAAPGLGQGWGGPMEAEGFALCNAPALQTKVFQYRIWDVNQKSLYLRNDQLVAGHLQGANAALEERVFWVPNRAFEPARLPVILGIQNGTRCLASPPASQPTLQLQDADIRELPRAGVASAAFTFFRSYKDGLWRFESAANPGWFLCTSARGHQPLGLSRHPDATHLLDFYFQLC
ncbi:uncharacterized protein LOC115349857 isoform X1 [Aquila chrysaetos chrysaetos]|uniref:uncharacterized protein LOC115349857 isoform X1 n=1 Tax=Aquila chrysaetos chrysaetos TaxID=223781 RepID=UPI001176A1BA|nr:uncharacterized protein LOC115349857 isoform X1 [Aquila chrysaetos chrysaetos]